MAAWKILLTDGLEEGGQEILRKSAEVVNDPTITADRLLQVVGEYDALIVRGRTKVTAAVLEAGKKLKVLHVIDNSPGFLKYLNKQNISLNDIIIIKEVLDFDRSVLVELKGKKEVYLSAEASKKIMVE